MSTRIFVQAIYTEAHPTKGAEGYAVMNDGMRPVYEKTAELRGDLYRSLGLTHSKHLTYRNDVPAALAASIDAAWFPKETH